MKINVNNFFKRAISSFYEGDENDLVEPMDHLQTEDLNEDDDEDDFEPPSRQVQKQSESKRENKPRSSGPKIHTIRDEDDDEKPDEQGQAFYAGGSQTSGQQIIGPSKNNPEELIKNLFQKAKEYTFSIKLDFY